MTKKLIDRLEEITAQFTELTNEAKVIVHQLREPSTIQTVEDVIEFEGQQYKKVNRKAREGDVVICKNQENTDETPIEDGQAYLVGKNGWFKKHGFGVYTQYHNRTPKTVDVYELIVEDIPFDSVDYPIDYPLEEEKTPNRQRAEVIEKAKKFVEENIKQLASYDFVTSEGLVKLCYRKVYREWKIAVAQCMPSDVFNENIGKAIALGRALGLDVSEFENVVQPTGKVIGQIIQIEDGRKATIIQTGILAHIDNGTVQNGSTYAITGKIINDTNAIYKEDEQL